MYELVLLLQKTSVSLQQLFSTVRKLVSTWGIKVLRVAAARTRTNVVNMFNIWSNSIKVEQRSPVSSVLNTLV
jgi:hypothetical protein